MLLGHLFKLADRFGEGLHNPINGFTHLVLTFVAWFDEFVNLTKKERPPEGDLSINLGLLERRSFQPTFDVVVEVVSANCANDNSENKHGNSLDCDLPGLVVL